MLEKAPPFSLYNFNSIFPGALLNGSVEISVYSRVIVAGKWFMVKGRTAKEAKKKRRRRGSANIMPQNEWQTIYNILSPARGPHIAILCSDPYCGFLCYLLNNISRNIRESKTNELILVFEYPCQIIMFSSIIIIIIITIYILYSYKMSSLCRGNVEQEITQRDPKTTDYT